MNNRPFRIVSLIEAAVSAVFILLWFLPVAKIGNKAYSLLGTADTSSDPEGLTITFYVIIGFLALSVVWALIPKKWAAIVGLIFSLLAALLAIFQVGDWKSHDLNLTIWAHLMIPVAVLCVIIAIVRVILAPKKNKMNRIGA